MNREADQVIRVPKPLKRQLEQTVLRLQVDLERIVTYAEMLGAAWDQVVYEHLLAELRTKGGKS